MATVLLVSLIAHQYVQYQARTELYQSRELLARGLADNIAQQLEDQLSEIRDELSSWAPFLAELEKQSSAVGFQAAFQDWLHGLGNPTTSRYDAIAVVDHDGRLTAINEVGLSVPAIGRLVVKRETPVQSSMEALLGHGITEFLNERDAAWLRRTLLDGLPSGLPWRSIAVINEAYERETSERTQNATRDDVVRRHQLVFTQPVAHIDGRHGAVVAIVSWAPFQRLLDEAERYLKGVGLPTGYAFLFDGGGDHIIGHKLRDPQESDPNRYLLDKSVTRDFDLPNLRDAAVVATGRAFEYDFPKGNKKFAVMLPIDRATGRSNHVFDWRLGIGVDHSDIYAPLARLRDATIWATLAVAFAVAIVGIGLGRSLSLSVREFTHLAEEASKGRFDLISRTATHDEISDFALAMNRLFVSMRERTHSEPVTNPYVVGTPLRSASMFYGRDEDLRWIADQLERPGNEMLALYGQRRIGKTSLLHQIRNQRESAILLPVFIDTHGLLPVLHSDEDFYWGLKRVLARELSVVGNADEPIKGRGADALVALVRSLNAQFPARTLVLLFDEMDALDMKTRDGILSSAIGSFLAALLESDCRVSMIATGSTDSSRLGGPFSSVLAPKSLTRRIGLLSPAEGRRLILEPVAGHLEFDAGVPDRILRLTGSHPYYTQTVCQRVIDSLNERRLRRVSFETVSLVTEQLLGEPPLPLDDMWSSSTPLQRWLMAEIARLLSDSEGYVSAEAILVSSANPPSDVVAELRTLTSIEILEDSSGRYRFPVDFVRLWIRKEQLWWKVMQQRSSI